MAYRQNTRTHRTASLPHQQTDGAPSPSRGRGAFLCLPWSATLPDMGHGKYGTPMTTFRIPRQRGPEPERGTRLCPVCWQLAGDPCRALISTSGKGKIRLGKLLTKMHDARRGDSTGDPGKLPPKPKAPERPRKDGLGFTYPKHGRSVEHPS